MPKLRYDAKQALAELQSLKRSIDNLELKYFFTDMHSHDITENGLQLSDGVMGGLYMIGNRIALEEAKLVVEITKEENAPELINNTKIK